jgi:hypothetical protein
MIRFRKNELGKTNISINPIPRFNISLIFQIVAVLSSWALHESVLRSLIAFLFGFLYLIAWAIFGDSATKEGIDFIINYYRTSFN